MAKKTAHWRGCPIRYGAAMIGDRWKLLILRDAVFKGARRYGDFLGAGEGVATNILASRLAQLEQDGILSRERDADDAARTVYALTEKGRELVPMLVALIAWSAKWDTQTEVPATFARAAKRDPKALAHKIVTQLKAPSQLE